MTDGDLRPNPHDCGGDAAAYVLRALDPDELGEFHHHLDSCAVCRDEVASLRHVTDALLMAAPQQPVPKALRRRVMRQVHAERKLVPHLEPRGRRPVFRAGLLPRPALAGGMLAAIVLTALGGLELAPGGSSGVRVIQASVAGGPGSAQVRVAGAHAELVVSHLSPPPAGRIYELWIRRGTRPPSPTRALFSVTAAGGADVGVPGSVRGVSAIMVTQEPAGGSLIPTHAPVILARLI